MELSLILAKRYLTKAEAEVDFNAPKDLDKGLIENHGLWMTDKGEPCCCNYGSSFHAAEKMFLGISYPCVVTWDAHPSEADGVSKTWVGKTAVTLICRSSYGRIKSVRPLAIDGPQPD
jgi:hypothetical protein